MNIPSSDIFIFTSGQRSYGEVKFSVISVCPGGGEEVPCDHDPWCSGPFHTETSLYRYPRPLLRHGTSPCRDPLCSNLFSMKHLWPVIGRSASCWNAFLLYLRSLKNFWWFIFCSKSTHEISHLMEMNKCEHYGFFCADIYSGLCSGQYKCWFLWNNAWLLLWVAIEMFLEFTKSPHQESL